MYKLKKITNSGVRIGQIENNGKVVNTPSYFFISNVGGGGTNVSRMFSYFDLFSSGESQLLLNYYYLNTYFKKLVDFDRDVLQKLPEFVDILDFMIFAKNNFHKRSKVSNSYVPPNKKFKPLVMLDSGSGNIFRDLVQNGQINSTNFESIYETEVIRYEEFAAMHLFDLCIAMDVAGKYTSKQGEDTNENYKRFLSNFSGIDSNISLLEKTLRLTPMNKSYLSYAPIHGKDVNSYWIYLNKILEVEKRATKTFDGFAIGGLGSIRSRTELYAITKKIRETLKDNGDDRPIHILGVGALQNIIPMSILGADSFDCHSPWRRASEGKYVIPLLNSKLSILQNNRFWNYIPLTSITERDLSCDCLVCTEFSLYDLKKLYSKGSEDQYFAKILLFKHNITQQEKLCQLCKEQDLYDLISNFPDGKNKANLLEVLSELKS